MAFSLGIIFGLLTMFAFGISTALSQIPTKKLGTLRTIFFRNIFASLVLLISILFFLKETKFSPLYILIAFGVSLIGYFSLCSFFQSLKFGKVGVVSPVANSFAGFTVLFSVIFFKETLTWTRLSSILLIILGIVLISINFRDIRKSHLFHLHSGVPFALLTCLAWGAVFFLFKIPGLVLGPFLTSFIVEFGTLVFSTANLKISKVRLRLPDKRMLAFLFIVGATGALGTLFYNLGIRSSDVSIVVALASANPLVSAIYGKIVYREKLTLLQYFAGLLILSGIVLISYF